MILAIALAVAAICGAVNSIINVKHANDARKRAPAATWGVMAPAACVVALVALGIRSI